jgi:hypothetical protein
MKLPVTRDAACCGPVDAAARPVPRVKRSLATSLCGGASASWALGRRAPAPYRFSDECFCLSPEQHGAQFRGDGWELRSLKGQC